MTKTFIGAVSLSALMAIGLTACAKNVEESADASSEQEAAYAELNEAENEIAEELAAVETNDPYTQTTETDPYVGSAVADPYDEVAANEPDQAMAGVNGDGVITAEETAEIITIAEIRDEADVRQMVDAAFESADLDNDGALSKLEYASLAAAVQIADGDAIDAVDGMVGGDGAGAVAETTDEGEPAMTLPGDEIFAEAAGVDNELSKDDLRASFLARFEAADVNHDARLDEGEREEFVRLAMGKRVK